MKITKIVPMIAIAALAQSAFAADAQDVQKRVSDATAALEEVMSVPETSIPTDLLAHATCVLNVGLYRAGFVFGGEGGGGVASCRDASGKWSAPIFVNIGGGSFGFQIGVEQIDLTLVFTNKNARQSLESTNFKLDANAGLTAGPVGRDLSAGTNFRLDDAIYSYSRSRGAFAGVTLEGSFIAPANDFNQVAYGRTSTSDILAINGASAPASVRPYVNALDKY